MKYIASLALATAGLLAAPIAQAHTTLYSAFLSGPAEAPANNSPGTGTVLITLDYDLVTMRVQASFSGLLGNTTASHIHAATVNPFASTAGVATQTPTFTGFPLGVTSGSYDQVFDMTLAASYNTTFITNNGGTVSGAFNALTSAMDNGKAYFNVHTSSFPGGEIRGFLTVVPEPGTASLATLLGAGIFLRRRR